VFNASIALAGGEVKRKFDTPPGNRGTQAQEPGRSARPNVLCKMPLSCTVIFDVLRTMASNEALEISIRELAQTCRLSPRQVRRALTRLEAANLLQWERGKRNGTRSVIELNWHPASFPQKGGASKSQTRNPLGKRTSEVPYYSENINTTKEPSGLTSPLNWNQAFNTNAEATRQTELTRPVWANGPMWCTRRVWGSLAGRVRGRAAELWGTYGDTATDAIMATAARAVRAGLIESEEELRELIRHLGGRLRGSGHAIAILRDRPRAFAYLAGVARRWLRQHGRLKEPEGVDPASWPEWQETAFEVLDGVNWAWERREKPLADVTGIVGKVARAWVETPPGRLHRRVEAVSLRGFEFEEARWIVLAGLAAALGTPIPEPPRRDPYEHETPEQRARRLFGEVVFCGGGDLT